MSVINIEAINALTSTLGFLNIETQIGLAYPQESYQDTADRLRDAGDNDNADLYEALETRWYEIEDGVE